MIDDERRTRQPLSMTRRYRRGLILTGLLCALAVLTAATVLFQRSYAERIDNYLMQICHGYAAAYEAQDTHSATTLLNLLPENLPPAHHPHRHRRHGAVRHQARFLHRGCKRRHLRGPD